MVASRGRTQLSQGGAAGSTFAIAGGLVSVQEGCARSRPFLGPECAKAVRLRTTHGWCFANSWRAFASRSDSNGVPRML